MEDLIRQISRILIKTNLSVAVAESCTGGLLSKYLTDMPGSSRYFIFGVITYSNKAKEEILKIPPSLIIKKGAVSKEVAGSMACAVRKILNSDIGIGITGIAGPSGARPGKPIGTVFIAVNTKNKKIIKKFNFKGTRSQIRKHAALKGLELLKKALP